MRILHQYIVKEVVLPFLMAVAVLTFVLLMGNLLKLADLVINKGVGLGTVSTLFLLFIPYVLNYTLPMAALTAALLSFGRMAADNEITAMKASGINIWRIITPVIILSGLVSVSSLLIKDKVLPTAHYTSRKMLKEIGIKQPQAYLEAGTFIRQFRPYVIFIYAMKDTRLYNLRIYQPQPNGPPRTVIARYGELLSLPDEGILKMKLVNGTSDEPDPHHPDRFYKLNFKTYYLSLLSPGQDLSAQIGKKPMDMSIKELYGEIRRLRAEGIDPTPYVTEFHEKFSLSFASLIMVLLGIPLAVRTRRGEKSVAFGLTSAIVIVYYLMLIGGETIALKGWCPTFVGAWTPNLVLGAVGVWMTRRVVLQ